MDVATRAFCASDYLLFFLSGCRNCLDLHSFPTRRSSDLIIGAHEPQDALVVHRPALAPQQRIEATVAVVAVGDREALEHITQLDLFTPGSHAPPVPIVARAADASQRAHPLDGEGALRGRHRVDEREDALAPRPPLGRGGSLTCCKASLKKLEFHRLLAHLALEVDQSRVAGWLAAGVAIGARLTTRLLHQGAPSGP